MHNNRTRPGIGLGRWLGGLLLGLAPWVAMAAQVVLSHQVQKVETFVDDNGVAQRRLIAAERVVAGDELRYTIRFRNDGTVPVDAGRIVITNPIPDATTYLEGTAFGAGTEIHFSADSGSSFATAEALTVVQPGSAQTGAAKAQDYTTIRWVVTNALAPGESSHVSFNVTLE